MTMTTAKQKVYKTAYSPLFGVYVSIDHAHQDDSGAWIFTCNSNYSDTKLVNHLFREYELTQITL
jgi:hypothetical protein